MRDPEMVAQLLAHGGDPVAALTRRERAILGLMAQGTTTRPSAAGW